MQTSHSRPGERLEVAGVAVAGQFLDLAGPHVRVASAVEERQLVAAREGVAHLVRPRESSAAQDQDAQRLGGARDAIGQGTRLPGRALRYALRRSLREGSGRKAEAEGAGSGCLQEMSVGT